MQLPSCDCSMERKPGSMHDMFHWPLLPSRGWEGAESFRQCYGRKKAVSKGLTFTLVAEPTPAHAIKFGVLRSRRNIIGDRPRSEG